MRGLLSTAILFGSLASVGAVAVACREPEPVVAASVTPPSSSVAADAGASAAEPSPSVASCSSDEPYIPAAAPSGRRPDLPEVPTLPQHPTKVGDAFTVFGATHALRSRFAAADVRGEIAIVGYVVDENMKSAPACAIHKTGKADPEGCIAPVPSFTIADDKTATTGIKVLGWARNFAVVFDANKAYATGKPAQPVRDDIWSVDVPYPLPAVGAKVKVTGTYSFAFTKSSSGMAAEPENGILTYARMETLEPAPRPAHLGK